MIIHLLENLEAPILEVVNSGRYTSLDDAMTDAASMLVERLKDEQTKAKPPTASCPDIIETHKPIWEVFEEITTGIPAEEWAKLPVDGAEQHDHYIYRTPKQPPS